MFVKSFPWKDTKVHLNRGKCAVAYAAAPASAAAVACLKQAGTHVYTTTYM